MPNRIIVPLYLIVCYVHVIAKCLDDKYPEVPHKGPARFAVLAHFQVSPPADH